MMKFTAKLYKLRCKYCGIQHLGERMNIKGRKNSGCEVYICHYRNVCKIPTFSYPFPMQHFQLKHFNPTCYQEMI